MCAVNRSGPPEIGRCRYARAVALAAWLGLCLDRVLFRQPFEGRGARRYAAAERPAFGDLDDRLLDGLPALTTARRLLDLGAGPGTFAIRAAARHPGLTVLAVDPSRDYAGATLPEVQVVRAAGEALPLAAGSCDVAICLSSIRHVRDRDRTFAELRRVVRPGGSLVIVELDPDASAARIAAHADHLESRVMRHAFGPLVCKTAPSADSITALATRAGWRLVTRRPDSVQPVYILELA